MYVLLWEFTVSVQTQALFEAIYGPDGDWQRLFTQHEGYIRTDLMRDQTTSGRYVTCDFWHSERDYQAFKNAAGSAYQALDARCDALTVSEKYLGSFDIVSNSAR